MKNQFGSVFFVLFVCSEKLFWVSVSSSLHSSLLWLCVHLCHLWIFVWSVTTATTQKTTQKNNVSACARVRLATAWWNRSVCGTEPKNNAQLECASKWLATHITLPNTHTHSEKERETHTQHFLLLTRNTVAAVFHLNEFLNLFVPSPLAAASWWKTETEGVGCQINWCVRRERGQNGVIKRKAFLPSHTDAHRQQEKTERGGSASQTWLPQKSSPVHSLFFTQPSRAALPLGWLCIKNCLSALFFSLARLINWQKKKI